MEHIQDHKNKTCGGLRGNGPSGLAPRSGLKLSA